MAAFKDIIVILTCFCSLSTDANDIISGGNFESWDSTSPWFCQGNCTLTRSTDSHGGNFSIKVTDRHQNWDGLAQNVPVVGGVRYKLSAYIKLLNLENGSLYQNVDMIMMCLDANGTTEYIVFGHSPYVQLHTGWTQIGGIAQVPTGQQFCHVYIQVNGTNIPWTPPGLGLEKYLPLDNWTPRSTVSYLVDDMTLAEVTVYPNWRNEAYLRIDQLRKADLTIRIVSRVVGGDSRNDTEVELIQTSHEFPFGSAVQADAIVNSSFSKYQQVFYDNFNWAVLENALKWRKIEQTRGQIDYQPALAAIKAVREKGIPIRGHTVFWGPWYMQQQWKHTLSHSQLVLAMREHLYGVVEQTKGMLDHWDINNENLHGDWYEQQTGNANVTMEMFNDVNALDSHPKLFLNDFGILQYSDRAMALKLQAKLYKEANTPIHGIGIQSHLSAKGLDMTLVKARLDLVAEAGLPIWITELTVAENNNTKKAEALEDLMTLYFSHPAVEGVLLWGFWDQRMYKGKEWSLFDGPDISPNEAGLAYLKLYHTTWRTNETHSLQGQQPLHVRAFKGDYRINVKQGGQVVKSETFKLNFSGKLIEVHLNGSGRISVIASLHMLVILSGVLLR